MTKSSSQAIGTVVLSSFIEHKLHPSQNSIVPCLLMNSSTVRVLLFDCVEDILLISDKVSFVTGSYVEPSTLLFLWLFLNHRYAPLSKEYGKNGKPYCLLNTTI